MRKESIQLKCEEILRSWHLLKHLGVFISLCDVCKHHTDIPGMFAKTHSVHLYW